MKDYFFNARDDFHYDHSGYYGYIVFNGDKQTCDGLLKALGQGAQPGGLGWYRYGKSFRPANDGKMYNWYIRLHSGGSEKPAAQAVDDFLRGHLEPPKPAPQPPSQESIVATQSPSQEFLLRQFDVLASELKQNFGELRSEVQAGTAVQVELRDVVAQGTANSVALEAAQQELAEAGLAREGAEQALAEAEKALEELQAELIASQTESPGNRQWHEAYNEAETQNRRLSRDKKDLEREMKGLKREIKKSEDARDNFATQFLEASKKIGELEKSMTVANQVDSGSSTAEKRMKVSDLENILEGAFPRLVLVRDSLDTLHHEIQNYRPVFQRLHQIANVPKYNGRNSLKGKSKWREDTIGKRWRIYFCKESMPGNKFVVYLGDKNHQNDDMSWLFSNPPETCL